MEFQSMISVLASTLVIGSVLLIAGMVVLPALFGSPWHPLSSRNIRRILEFAEVRPGERIFDPGSGDGRVLIAATRYFGALGTGVEIDPVKVWLSKVLCRRAGVAGQVNIHRGNLFDFDYREADILYLYLTHQAMDKLLETIFHQLKPTARIVCFRFCLRNMEPVKVNAENNLFLYRIDKGRAVNAYS